MNIKNIDGGDRGGVLFFATYQYPFLPGEYFIESEIDHLVDAFDRVLVFPDRSLWWKSNEAPRVMPAGAELCDVREASVWKRLFWVLKGGLGAMPFMWQSRSVWPGEVKMPLASFMKRLKASFKVMTNRAAIQWFLQRKMIKEKPVAYAYWRIDGAGALALLKKQGYFSSLYVRCHRCDIYTSVRYPFEGIIHEHANSVFPVSDDGKNYLTEEKGLSANNIEVKRLGVTLPAQCSTSSTDGVWRILSCSNIVTVKRVDLIAQTIAAIKHPCEWIHIGDGAGLDAVKAIAESFGPTVSAKFLGRISNSEVLRYYRENPVDLFINLSESEGVPVSIMEALAHGVPVVATDVGGSAEVIDGENGHIVDVDASALEASVVIKSLLSEPARVQRAREAARNMAEQRCSSVRNYSDFCQSLHEGSHYEN
jgi:colanic acid/amylovoran biosynthesis glycosyltransferase